MARVMIRPGVYVDLPDDFASSNDYYNQEFERWLESASMDDAKEAGAVSFDYALGHPFGMGASAADIAKGGESRAKLMQYFLKKYGSRLEKGRAELGEAEAEKGRQAEARKYLDDFYKEMLTDFDPTDPKYAKMLASIRGGAETRAFASGIEGGLSDAATARILADAQLGMQKERTQMGMDALKTSLGDVNQARGWRAEKEAAMGQRAFQDAQARYQHRTQQNQMWGSLLGGGLGAIGGGLVGGPAGVGLGAQMGSQFGAGLAGSGSGPPPGYGYQPGGGGGLGYGGGW